MQYSKTQIGFLSFLEKIIRGNGLIYFLIRNIVIHFNIFEEDFKILKKYFGNTKINIIDIGASDGISANFFSKNLNVNKIYCYEPHKYFIKKLIIYKKKNKKIILKKYGISYKQIKKIVYYPIIKFFNITFPLLTYTYYNKDLLKKQIKLDFYNHKKITIDKTTLKLKKFKNINNKIDLIKIDVNGFELDVVKGILNQIKRDRPVIVIENNSQINKINIILKKIRYKKFYSENLEFKKHKNQKVLDIFYLPQK
jgi:FkbM family methyltransferase